MPEFGFVPREREVVASDPASPLEPPSDWRVEGLGQAARPLLVPVLGTNNSRDFRGFASIDFSEGSAYDGVGSFTSIPKS